MSAHRKIFVLSTGFLLGLGLLAGCSDDERNAVGDGAAEVTQPDDSEETTDSDAGDDSSSDSGGAEEGIGIDEAVRLTQERFGGELDSVEPDHFEGVAVWEIELDDTDEGMDLEVIVDQRTGDILHYEEN